MMTTDPVTTAAALASLVVAGLGVYAYTQLGAVDDTCEHDTTHAQLKDTSGGGVRRGRCKANGKAAEHSAARTDKATAQAGDVLPGGFEATDPPDVPLAEPTPKAKKKKRKKKAGKTQDAETDARTAQPDTTPKKKTTTKGGKAGDGDAAGDSTDGDASSLSPFASGSARAPLDRVRAQRAMLRSLSLDTDSSWTHVDRRLSRAGRVEASSDVASTESGSPVAERVASDVRCGGEKVVSRSEGTSIDAVLEQPSVSTLARVMRVQPPADETPVPGFSWEDYGEVVEESVLVHDADQEDEGEWGIVKSRSRTQTPATATTAPHVLAESETVTKKQRQNARKRELAKAVKAETEAARLQGLAKHKRELERLRIIEQSRQGGGKQTSGGMHATVDDRGKLVWE